MLVTAATLMLRPLGSGAVFVGPIVAGIAFVAASVPRELCMIAKAVPKRSWDHVARRIDQELS